MGFLYGSFRRGVSGRFFSRLYQRFLRPGPRAQLERASQCWGKRAREKQDDARPIVSWTDSPFVLRHYVNPAISGNAEDNWFIWVAKEYFLRPVDRALSIGCGDGCLERHGLHLNVARTRAQELGYAGRVAYGVADLNASCFGAGIYDAVFASMSLHHIAELEGSVLNLCCSPIIWF